MMLYGGRLFQVLEQQLQSLEVGMFAACNERQGHQGGRRNELEKAVDEMR